jgi:ankyrin repeat protein
MDPEDPLLYFFADKVLLRELIDEGKPIGLTPSLLVYAAGGGDTELVSMLLSAGGRDLLDAFDEELSWTPLIAASKNGDAAMVTLLLEAGADVNANDEARAGDTALKVAVERGDFDTAKLLIEHDADPTIPGWMHLTPLDKARERKRMPELYALLSSVVKTMPEPEPTKKRPPARPRKSEEGRLPRKRR